MPAKPTCPFPGCLRDDHPQHPDAHVLYGAWAADRHDKTEPKT